MTILPKKKACPAAGDGDRDQPGSRGGGPGGPGGPGGVGGPDSRGCSGADSHPRGVGVGGGVGPGDPHSGRGGARPRASPPPPPPRWGLPPAGSPPPPNPGVGAGGDGPGLGLLDPGAAEARGGVGGGCCSGPGHSKRRRQGGPGGGLGLGGAAGPGGGGGNSPEQDDVGAGYNSEDEYETAAARIESMDPATVEQQEHRFEKALREKKGFIIKQMKEDGACLFRAVADQVYGDQDMHEVVRKHCMDYLVSESGSAVEGRFPPSHVSGLTQLYRSPILSCHFSLPEPINTFHGIHQNEDEPIRVSYHRNIHYNSVVNPNKATIGVGLGLPSFKPGYAEQSLMKNAIKTSEESWIEQQMLEDKKRATDWEATNEAIEEQVARESYLQWLRDQEKQARQPRKASATCSSATAAAASGLEEWSGRSPRQRSSASSPEHPDLHNELNAAKPPSPGSTAVTALALTKPPSPCAPGTSSQLSAGGGRVTPPLVSLYPALECRAIMQQMSPTAFGLSDWDDDEILASVLAVSQQEYLESMKKGALHRDSGSDKS
uniref:ubiquitinyl hydrolase 1 n=1 Tax=Naja naja TaxID=35670 RepID=A0A8C6XNX5_NAJNA